MAVLRYSCIGEAVHGLCLVHKQRVGCSLPTLVLHSFQREVLLNFRHFDVYLQFFEEKWEDLLVKHFLICRVPCWGFQLMGLPVFFSLISTSSLYISGWIFFICYRLTIFPLCSLPFLLMMLLHMLLNLANIEDILPYIFIVFLFLLFLLNSYDGCLPFKFLVLFILFISLMYFHLRL